MKTQLDIIISIYFTSYFCGSVIWIGWPCPTPKSKETWGMFFCCLFFSHGDSKKPKKVSGNMQGTLKPTFKTALESRSRKTTSAPLLEELQIWECIQDKGMRLIVESVKEYFHVYFLWFSYITFCQLLKFYSLFQLIHY